MESKVATACSCDVRYGARVSDPSPSAQMLVLFTAGGEMQGKSFAFQLHHTKAGVLSPSAIT